MISDSDFGFHLPIEKYILFFEKPINSVHFYFQHKQYDSHIKEWSLPLSRINDTHYELVLDERYTINGTTLMKRPDFTAWFEIDSPTENGLEAQALYQNILTIIDGQLYRTYTAE